MAAATELFRDLMKKDIRFEWTSKHEKAFELMKKKQPGSLCKTIIFMYGKKRELNVMHPREA